jgi:flavodoxin I
MKALVIYDSFFGNTEKVAQAIGRGLGPEDEVAVLRVEDVQLKHLGGLEILIAGSPTRAFRATPAMMKLLKGLPVHSLAGVKVAAFDTRVALEDVNSRFLNFMVGLFGYAAQPMLDKLLAKGGSKTQPAEGFYVEGTEGPLKEGELERADAWARSIASA